MTRTQKWMGSVGCFGQNKNKKRQSLITERIERAQTGLAHFLAEMLHIT